ncbi:MAG: inositol monophosphatase [Candidatus Melainabacteria bacterium]|nr:MAG: inositol monophosphatase [Candidatus Melainabacteria bacterium]
MKNARKIATRAALEAGKILKERLGDVRVIDYKAAYNIVTDVDKASEAKIFSIIKDEFPEDDVLAEESGFTKGQTSKRRWLIDPLDGTTNYAHTYPFFSVSIGLEEEGKRILGIVYNPMTDELFAAEPGQGAYLNDERMFVSDAKTLQTSLLATGFPPDTSKALRTNILQFKTLTDQTHGVRRDGSAALDLCYVASGRLDGFWEMKLAPWDIGAGSLIVEEAGGKVSNLAGGPLDISTGHILATNGKIHDELVEVLTRLEKEESSQSQS